MNKVENYVIEDIVQCDSKVLFILIVTNAVVNDSRLQTVFTNFDRELNFNSRKIQKKETSASIINVKALSSSVKEKTKSVDYL